MASELKPCPFCGGEADLERIGDRRKSTIITCGFCGALMETGEGWDHGAAWNRRPREDEVSACFKAAIEQRNGYLAKADALTARLAEAEEVIRDLYDSLSHWDVLRNSKMKEPAARARAFLAKEKTE